jgi:hypothetical protein
VSVVLHWLRLACGSARLEVGFINIEGTCPYGQVCVGGLYPRCRVGLYPATSGCIATSGYFPISGGIPPMSRIQSGARVRWSDKAWRSGATMFCDISDSSRILWVHNGTALSWNYMIAGFWFVWELFSKISEISKTIPALKPTQLGQCMFGLIVV